MNVRPKIQLLTPEQMNEVHHYSIRILEETGIEVESKEALRIFEKSDGLKVKNGAVYLSGELINEVLQLAPSNIEVYNKSGDVAFQLGLNPGQLKNTE